MENMKRYVVIVATIGHDGIRVESVIKRDHKVRGLFENRDPNDNDGASFYREFSLCPADQWFSEDFRICHKLIAEKIVKDIREWKLSASESEHIKEVEARAVEVEFKFNP